MKKIILTALLGLSISNLFGQNKIIHEHDVMTDKDYYYMKNDLLVSEDGKIGFNLSIYLGNKDNKVYYKGISCKVAGVGSCHENDKLIILFDDSTKVEYGMWNNFNCNGNAYFDFTSKGVNEFNKSIKAIRITNGRTYDSYTKVLKSPSDKRYFMDVIEVLNKQDIEEKK